ncbi:MAG: AAA family ATPase [Coraliomargaritaceae bacterium]
MHTEANNQESLTGVLERIIFSNEENAYCVAELSVEKNSQPTTILGNLPGVQCGETLQLTGQWTRHPTHGDQFKISNFTSRLPASVHGIRKYLGSGMVPGIGKSYASKIVDYFGADTLAIISSDSGRLHEIPGIGKTRAKAIKSAWDQQVAVRDIIIFLQTYGVTPAQCVRLVKKYGNGAKRVLQDAPYRLAEDIENIGFKTADKLALNLGFPTNSKERIDAGILHTLRKLEEDGHTIGLQTILVETSTELLGLQPHLIEERIRRLIKEKRLYSLEAIETDQSSLGPACQRPPMAGAEKRIAQRLITIHQTPSTLPSIKAESAIEWAQQRAGFTFAPKQADALKRTLSAKVSIITGGPGTGKTTILRSLVDILKAKRARILLASPTGRAAQRLSEAAGAPASTLHRLLKYDGATRTFIHDADNPLPCDVIIVDEASMLDTRLANSLAEAIPATACLLLVGDSDQLPSVGPGNILSDLMTAPPARVSCLDTIFRQGETSGIVTTAHGILKGEAVPPYCIDSLRRLDPEQDCTFIEAADAEQTADAIRYLSAEFLPKTYGIDPIRDIQVLCPMHRGTAGISALNASLQEALNNRAKAQERLAAKAGTQAVRQVHFREKTRKPLPAELNLGAAIFRIGDKVIQTRNNYDKNIFNGDTGIIVGIAPDASSISIDFDGENVEYTKSELSEVRHAYAISIHKSQGSEYPVVLIPLLKQHFMMLQRNLVYTGITRARRKVFLIGSTEAYSMAIRNNKTEVRRTHLRSRLHKAIATAKESNPLSPS